MSQHTVLLTGLPRSGTTLSCELLNLLPDTVALDEPIDLRPEPATGRRAIPLPPFGDKPPDARKLCDYIDRSLAEMRESIFSRRTAPSYQVEGKVLGAKVADDREAASPRVDMAVRDWISIDKPLSATFLLVAKHLAAFTALLEPLLERFPVYAVVRNPLAVLSSWRTVPFPIGKGHVTPFAQRVDPQLAAALAETDDLLDRQLQILDWYFDSFRRLLPLERIVRYESIVESGGKSLSAITPAASELDQRLESRNSAAVYDRDDVRLVRRRLLDSEGAYWSFYTRETVAALIPS